jgi:hypothetical protein
LRDGVDNTAALSLPSSKVYNSIKFRTRIDQTQIDQARKRICEGHEDLLLSSQLLLRMRQRDEAALELGPAIFLRRLRPADRPGRLCQTFAGAPLRNHARRFGFASNRSSEIFSSAPPCAHGNGRLGARFRDGRDRRSSAGIQGGAGDGQYSMRRTHQKRNSLQTSRSARTTLLTASRHEVDDR